VTDTSDRYGSLLEQQLRRYKGDETKPAFKSLSLAADTTSKYRLAMNSQLERHGAHPAYSSAQDYADLVSGLMNGNVSVADLRPRDLHASAELIAQTVTSGDPDAQAVGFSLYHRFDGQTRMDEALDSIDPAVRTMIPSGDPPQRPWWMKALQGAADVFSVGWDHVSAPAIVAGRAIIRGDWQSVADLANSWNRKEVSIRLADQDDDGYVDVYEALGQRPAEGKLETGVGMAAEIAFDPLTYLTFGASPAARAALGATGRGLRAAGRSSDEITAIAASLQRGRGFGDEAATRVAIGSLADDAARSGADLVRQRPGLALGSVEGSWRAAAKEVPERWRPIFDEAVEAVDVGGLDDVAAEAVRAQAARSTARSLRALDRARGGPRLAGVRIPWSQRLTPSGLTPGRTFSPQFEKIMGGKRSVVRSVLSAPRAFTPRARIISSMGLGVADDFRHLLRPARSDAQLLREVGESPGGRIHDHVTALFMSRASHLRDPVSGHALTAVTFRGAGGDAAGLLGFDEASEAALAPVRDAWAYADQVAGQPEYAARADAALQLEFNTFGDVWGDQMRAAGMWRDGTRALSSETAERLTRSGGAGWTSMVKSGMARRLELPDGVTYLAHPEIAGELRRGVLSVGAQTNIEGTSNLITRAYGTLRFLNNVASANALSLLRGLGFPFNNLIGAMGNNVINGVSPRVMAAATPEAARLVWNHERALSVRKRWNVLQNWVDESWERLPDGVRETESAAGRALLGGVDDIDALFAHNSVNSLEGLIAKQVDDGVITPQRARLLRRSMRSVGDDPKQWASSGDDVYLNHLRAAGVTEDGIENLAYMQVYGVVSGGRSRDILDEFVQRETRGRRPDISRAALAGERRLVRQWREAAEQVDEATDPAQRAKLRSQWEQIDADVRARGLGHRLDEELRANVAPELGLARHEIEHRLAFARSSYRSLVQQAKQYGLTEDAVITARGEVEHLERLLEAVERPLESHADPLVAKVEFLQNESHVAADRATRAKEIAALQRKLVRERNVRDRLRAAAEEPAEEAGESDEAAAMALPEIEVPDPQPILDELTAARSRLDELAAPETAMRARIEAASGVRRKSIDNLNREWTQRLLTDRQVEHMTRRQRSEVAHRTAARARVDNYYQGPEAEYTRRIKTAKRQLRAVLEGASRSPAQTDRMLRSIRNDLVDGYGMYSARAQAVNAWTDELVGEGTSVLRVREGDERVLRVSEVAEEGPRGVAQRAQRMAERYLSRLEAFDRDPAEYLQERVKTLTGRRTRIVQARETLTGPELRRVIDNELLPELQADEEYWAFQRMMTDRLHSGLRERAVGLRLPDEIRGDVERMAADILDDAQGYAGRSLRREWEDLPGGVEAVERRVFYDTWARENMVYDAEVGLAAGRDRTGSRSFNEYRIVSQRGVDLIGEPNQVFYVHEKPPDELIEAGDYPEGELLTDWDLTKAPVEKPGPGQVSLWRGTEDVQAHGPPEIGDALTDDVREAFEFAEVPAGRQNQRHLFDERAAAERDDEVAFLMDAEGLSEEEATALVDERLANDALYASGDEDSYRVLLRYDVPDSAMRRLDGAKDGRGNALKPSPHRWAGRAPSDTESNKLPLLKDVLDQPGTPGAAAKPLPEVRRFEIERQLGRIGVLEGEYADAVEAGLDAQRRRAADEAARAAAAEESAAFRAAAAEKAAEAEGRIGRLGSQLEALHAVDAKAPTKLGPLRRGLTSEDVQTAIDEAAWAKTRWLDADRVVGVNNTGRRSTIPQKVQDSFVGTMNLGTQRAAYGLENWLRSMTYLSGRRMGMDPRGAADLSIGTNFDYDDITPQEYAFKSVASRFYTYPRKLMGFMGQQLANEPARVLSRTRIMLDSAKYITYLNAEDDEMEIVMPDWIASSPGYFHAGDKVVRIRFPMSEYLEPLQGALSLVSLMRDEDAFAHDDIPSADAVVEAGGWLTSNFFGFIPGVTQYIIESSISRDLFTGQSLDREAGHERLNRTAGVLLPGFSSGARQGVRTYETWTGESPHARAEAWSRMLSAVVGAWQRNQTEIDRMGLSDIYSDVEDALETLLDEGVAIHTVSELESMGVIQGGQRLRRALHVGDEHYPSGAPRRWAEPLSAFDLRELAPWTVRAAMNWQPMSRFVGDSEGDASFAWGIAEHVRAEQGLVDSETWAQIKARLAVRSSAEAEASRVSPRARPRALPRTRAEEALAEVEAQRAALERVTERAGRMGVTVTELQDMVGWLPPVKVAAESMRAGGWSEEDIRAALLKKFAPDLQALFLEGYHTQLATLRVKTTLTGPELARIADEYESAIMVLDEFGLNGPLADYWARYAATPSKYRNLLGFPKLPRRPNVLDLQSDWTRAYDAVVVDATLQGVAR